MVHQKNLLWKKTLLGIVAALSMISASAQSLTINNTTGCTVTINEMVIIAPSTGLFFSDCNSPLKSNSFTVGSTPLTFTDYLDFQSRVGWNGGYTLSSGITDFQWMNVSFSFSGCPCGTPPSEQLADVSTCMTISHTPVGVWSWSSGMCMYGAGWSPAAGLPMSNVTISFHP